jgi:DNA-binding winged helix-turn-helix (wHTH) protein/tetratricopeptide (TPR) repeat protein
MKSLKNNGVEKEIYRFGGYLLDAERRELRFREREISLQPRVYQLLLYLVRNHERAVDKDELQDAVWPGMTVTETALTRAIMKARKAVGDDANRQIVIKTLHGHGYRFVARLEPGPGALQPAGESAAGPSAPGGVPETPAPAGATHEKGSRPRWSQPVLVVLGAVLLLAAVVAFLRLLAPGAGAPEGLRVAVLPVSNATGDPELAWTGLGLMSYASNLLALDNDIPVVPDGSVVSLVDGFGWNGDLADPRNRDLLDRLGQAYGASHLLAMTLQQEGGHLRMNYGLLQPDGRLREGTMVGEDGTVLVRGVVQSVYGLLLHRSRIGPEVELVFSDPFNNEAFGRGMSLQLEGRCAEAVPFFRLIVEQEPGLVTPRHELAACLRILGEWQEAEQLLMALVGELQALGASRPLARSLMVLGTLYNRTGRLDEAERTHGRALEVAHEIDDRNLAGRILQNLSIVAEDRSDWAAATELLDRAVAEYRRAGLEVLPGRVWAAHGNLKLDQGELVEAEGFFQQALETFRAVGDRRNEAMMLNNTGLVRRLQGRLDEAEQYHLQSLEIREAIGDRVGVGRIHGLLTVVYVERGQLAQAREAAMQAVQIARETRDRLFEGTSLAELGEAAAAARLMAQARERAGERWDEESEREYQRYLAAQ